MRIIFHPFLCAVSFLLASFFATATSAAPPKPGSALTTTQLPRTVRPIHYDVEIVPDATKLSFEGKVAVSIDVLQTTDQVTLNALNMAFSNVGLSGIGSQLSFAAPKVKVDATTQTATFTFNKSIPIGRYRLTMDYTGKIETQANGLFAIDYGTNAGKQRALYTQFEAADARRLIPSWDEPAYKASFTLEAIIPTAQMAISNMPVAKKTDLGDGRSRVKFATSPRMSTYLLFFGLGDFERATSHVDGTEIGVVTQKGLLPQAAFALDSTRDILHEYNDYFGMPYPLPKLDNVASPGSSQFFGAMENWGAIFTFEHSLLLDPAISTQADRQNSFLSGAHEIAHQWFGNLVTMRWWDDLWLNEGFASWMEGRTTEKLHPEWSTILTSVLGRENAMRLDALVTTHPVVQRVETVEQTSQAFDSITYSKGEAVIRMLEAYVGADAWRAGVRRYMRSHAYGSTISNDLWREIQAASGEKVIAIASDFTLKPGIPLIRVESATCHRGRTTLKITQGEFSVDRPDKKPLRWRVPVMIQRLGDKAFVRTLVNNGKASVTVPGCGAIVVNAGQSGYYRTMYDAATIAQIKLRFAEVAPIDQLGILTDTWALGLSGLRPMSDFLDLAQATSIDADPQIWGQIADIFLRIDEYFTGQPERQARFRTFAIGRLTPVFVRAGWSAKAGELGTTTILRSALLRTLSRLGDSGVIDEARRHYAAQHTTPGAIPAELRKVILAIVARHADAPTWEQLHSDAKAESTPMIKDYLYDMLSLSVDDGLARRALDLALTPEPGATNTANMISQAAQEHPDLAFEFALAHMAEVDARVDASSRSRYYPFLATRSADPAMIDKIKAYATTHLAETSRRNADTAVATIAYRIKIRNQRLPEIDAWLAGQVGATRR